MVPNLNVLFDEVYIVNWTNETCRADLNDKDDFDSTFVFDVDAPSSKEALTFYSRNHIENIKMIDLMDSRDEFYEKSEDVRTNDPICCGISGTGSCPWTGRVPSSTWPCCASDLSQVPC